MDLLCRSILSSLACVTISSVSLNNANSLSLTGSTTFFLILLDNDDDDDSGSDNERDSDDDGNIDVDGAVKSCPVQKSVITLNEMNNT